MKAFTVYQPYGSLIAYLAKIYETRARRTNYRGPVAIHAGLKHPYLWICNLPRSTTDAMIETLGGADLRDLPRGCVIATAELVECHGICVDPKTHRVSLFDSKGQQSGISLCSQELIFGDFRSGRYAWELANVKILAEPIPTRGYQGLWNWEPPGGRLEYAG